MRIISFKLILRLSRQTVNGETAQVRKSAFLQLLVTSSKPLEFLTVIRTQQSQNQAQELDPVKR
ncbi:MAG: hypothetical protein FJ271_23210 [Planctomycetes bacterium]|nr:hypothetical protein [Planctomycetota bacterium]